MRSYLDQMSTGIVGVEVKVASEPISPSVPIAKFGIGGNEASVGAMTIRKVGLWIRVTEIEGKEIPHSTAIFTPILQLVVTGSDDKVEKISTLAIDGRAPVEDAMAMPGAVRIAEMPPLEGVRAKYKPRPEHHPEHDRSKASGLLGWLAAKLGLEDHRGSMQGARRVGGCKGMMRKMKEHAAEAAPREKNVFGSETMEEAGVAPHRHMGHHPMLDNPFSDMADDDEGYAGDDKEIDHHFRPGHGHGPFRHGSHHKKHGRCRNFFRRMAFGVIFGLAMFGGLVLHPFTLMTFAALAAAGLTFHVVRRHVIKNRQGQINLAEVEEPLTDEKEKSATLEQVVVKADEQA